MSAASPYLYWHRYFLESPDALPWDHPVKLTSAERQLVAPAIRQFQLGEFARGRGLLRRAAGHPVLGADTWFVPALERFIAQEQGHSALLGRFLDREDIPRMKAHWVDGVFRRLRKLAGLEVCATVLVTAEVLAIPFYRALRGATTSPLLRLICARILRDEAAHLRYQALTLGLLRRPATHAGRSLRSLCHSALFCASALVLWQQHRAVFLAAGMGFVRFWQESLRAFESLQTRICQVSGDAGLILQPCPQR